MASRWFDIRKNIKKKRYSLRSLGAGILFFSILYILTKILNISLCPIKHLFGFSCFGCGMTRGFIAILEGNFKSAMNYNILAVPLFVGISVYAILMLADIIFGKEYVAKMETVLSRKYMYIVYGGLLLLSAILNNLLDGGKNF